MSTQPGRTVETARHLHYVVRMGGPEPRTPVLDSVESWNWAVRISVVGLFVLALAGIAYSMASVVVPVLLAWVVAMVLLPVVDSLERRGLSRPLTSIVLVVLLIASMVVIIGVLTVPLTYWVGRTSELGALLKERLQTLGNPLASLGRNAHLPSDTRSRRCCHRRSPTRRPPAAHAPRSATPPRHREA
jgi:hypothetical protein